MPRKGPPTYLRIAADLRERIERGDFPPGVKLPSQNDLQDQYGCTSTPVIAALRLLQTEGRIERRAGSGSFAKVSTKLVRRAYSRDSRTAQAASTSPFARDAEAAGLAPSWEHDSSPGEATPRIAERLGIEPGDPVMVTRYRFKTGDEPVQVSRSHEPLAITAGTPIEWPEQSAVAGVVARMDSIGLHVTRSVELVTARPASPDEAESLGLSPRGSMFVLALERTYMAGDVPVETADIVFAADRYKLLYEVPIDPA